MVILSASQARPQSLDSLLALRDSTLISESQIDLQLQIANILSSTDIVSALDYANQALKEAEEIGSVRWIAESKLAIGSLYDFLGVNIRASEYLMEALNSFELLNDSLKQASTLMQIGNTYFYLKQFDTALKKFTLVSEYGRALNDTSLIISGLNATAAVYGNISKMDSALILLKEAHALARQYGSLQQEILAYYNMGDVHSFLVGNFQIVLNISFRIHNHHCFCCRAPNAIGLAPESWYRDLIKIHSVHLFYFDNVSVKFDYDTLNE